MDVKAVYRIKVKFTFQDVEACCKVQEVLNRLIDAGSNDINSVFKAVEEASPTSQMDFDMCHSRTTIDEISLYVKERDCLGIVFTEYDTSDSSVVLKQFLFMSGHCVKAVELISKDCIKL